MLLLGSAAQAGCGPEDADFSVAPPLPSMPVSVDLNDEHVLLGKHGERVATSRELIRVDNTGDLLPRTWADEVDWSAYRLRGDANQTGARPAPTRLLFDADGRLCRIERYRSLRGRAQLEGGFTLRYDDAGALTGYREYEARSEHASAEKSGAGRYTVQRHACLQRNAQGQLTAYVSDGCGNASGAGPTRHYVRDATGQVRRVVDTASANEAVAVQRLDAQGKPGPRYVRRQPSYAMAALSDEPYGYPEPPAKTSDRPYPLFRDTLATLPTGIPDNDWRIVRIKDEVPLDEDDMMSWDPDTQIVLAAGKTDAEGAAVLPPAQQQEVWQAMRAYPWRVYFYSDAMTRVMLLPALTPAQWKACSDPANTAEDACPG